MGEQPKRESECEVVQGDRESDEMAAVPPSTSGASSYSTGGGGTVLEHRYGAVVLSHLLTHTPIPELGSDAVVDRVRFQARDESTVDDVLIKGRAGDGAERKVSVAVRRAPRLVPSDKPSVELVASYLVIVTAQWKELQSGRWRLALAGTATNATRELGQLAGMAQVSPDEATFRDAVARPGQTHRKVRDRLKFFDKVVEAAAQGTEVGGTTPSELTWRLLSVLTVRQLRLELPDEADLATVVGHLQRVTTDGMPATADRLLAEIIRLVGRYAPGGAEVNEAMVRRDLVGSADLKPSQGAPKASPTGSSVRDATTVTDLKASLPGLLADAVAQAGLVQVGAAAASAQSELEGKIDSARDLINEGLVEVARKRLEQLKETSPTGPQ